MTIDFRTLLKQAKLPERSVPVCLRGDLAADHEAAERALEAAQRAATNDMEGDGVGALVDRIETLQAEMREHTYDFRLRALPRHEYRELVAAHPPRRNDDGEVNQGDVALGFNQDTLIPDLIRRATIDPDLDDGEWEQLLGEKLTDRQYGDLADAAYFLNRGEVDVPFSRAASRAKRDSADG